MTIQLGDLSSLLGVITALTTLIGVITTLVIALKAKRGVEVVQKQTNGLLQEKQVRVDQLTQVIAETPGVALPPPLTLNGDPAPDTAPGLDGTG